MFKEVLWAAEGVWNGGFTPHIPTLFKGNSMLNTTFMQLRTHIVRKIKIYDTVWFEVNCCGPCYLKKLQIDLNLVQKWFHEFVLSKYVPRPCCLYFNQRYENMTQKTCWWSVFELISLKSMPVNAEHARDWKVVKIGTWTTESGQTELGGMQQLTVKIKSGYLATCCIVVPFILGQGHHCTLIPPHCNQVDIMRDYFIGKFLKKINSKKCLFPVDCLHFVLSLKNQCISVFYLHFGKKN